MANEKRLIYVNEVIEELTEERDNDCNRYMYSYQKEERDAKYDFAIDRLRDAPTVDAVVVVRCRDCEFCNYNSSSETYKCMSLRGMYGTVDPDGFCSYGERREGE